MATVLKIIFAAFVIAGIAISYYGCREILGTTSFLTNAPERVRGVFTGYCRSEVVSRSSTTNHLGEIDFYNTTSYMSYPEFEFVIRDGTTIRTVESKHHVFEWFKPGQAVDIIISPNGDHRLAGFYSLYFLDLCILILGLGFILVPLLFWNNFIPLLKTPAGARLEQFMLEQYHMIASTRVGPVSVRAIVKGALIFSTLVALVSVGSALTPYARQLHLGFGWGLIEALRKERFDDARELILKGKGINKVNEYDQTPLLLALEAGQFDLARRLIEAGVKVNIKSKMYKTPLLVAVQAGNLEMVKLLLSRGASADSPSDEMPPVFHALAKKQYEIARALIESPCDLNRSYTDGQARFTVGDMTVLARRPDLTELVRRRGGTFTPSAQ
jgi:hypothetical protein